MHALALLARVEIVAIASLLLVTVVLGLLRGPIATDGLLDSKTTGHIDPARVQLLLVTLLVAATLLGRIADVGAHRSITLPSALLIPILGSSHLVYLARKYWQVFREHP